MLWSNDRIMAELSEYSAAHKNDWNAAYELLYVMRNEYEAQLAAQSEWEPLEDNEYMASSAATFRIDGNQLTIRELSHREDALSIAITLPRQVRLYRLRTPAVRDAGNAAPQPMSNIVGMIEEMRQVEQTLGEALSYPRYSDDLKNFPEATEADGVCVGEHTVGTLAQEAAAHIRYCHEELTQFKKERILDENEQT